jgi:hypothetical protein
VSEIDGDIGGYRERGVVGHLGALVVGDRPPQVVGQPTHRFSQFQGDAAGGPVVRNSVEDEEPGRSLDRRQDLGGAVGSDDEVGPPVPGDGPVVGLCGSFADAHHVGDPCGAGPGAALDHCSFEVQAQGHHSATQFVAAGVGISVMPTPVRHISALVRETGRPNPAAEQLLEMLLDLNTHQSRRGRASGR